MTEKCTFSIRAAVNGTMRTIECNPAKGCLRKKAWSGKGPEGAAADAIGISRKKVISATVEGKCPNGEIPIDNFQS